MTGPAAVAATVALRVDALGGLYRGLTGRMLTQRHPVLQVRKTGTGPIENVNLMISIMKLSILVYDVAGHNEASYADWLEGGRKKCNIRSANEDIARLSGLQVFQESQPLRLVFLCCFALWWLHLHSLLFVLRDETRLRVSSLWPEGLVVMRAPEPGISSQIPFSVLRKTPSSFIRES